MSSLDIVLNTLDHYEISMPDLITTLLTARPYRDHHHRRDLIQNCSNITRTFLCHPETHDTLVNLSFDTVEEALYRELRFLALAENGWHFGISRATTNQMEEFSLKEMAKDIKLNAPHWWGLLGLFLDGEKLQNNLPKQNSLGLDDETEDCNKEAIPLDETLDDIWDQVDEIDLEGIISGLVEERSTEGLPMRDRRERRRLAGAMMKKTIVTGIIAHGMNQKANLLQSLLGFFVQSTHTPYKVIDTLARIGLSVSTDSINRAVESLSAESQNALQSLGQSLLASYAYDNFDIDLKSEVPTAEKLDNSLKHLTSGLMFPIVHGVTVEDLRCSEGLWQRSPLNRHATELPPKHSWRNLINLHPDSTSDGSSLSRQDKFNAWLFLRDLCMHGPPYFQQFLSQIQEPETVEQIPLVKTQIFATQAMDVNNSTVAGNIQAVNQLLEQGGIVEPLAQPNTESQIDSPDISPYVVLVHSDLGTGERLQSMQLQRSVESTPWNCMQHVLFIPGLFHLKMACTDTLWRCFLHPPTAHEDETSLMRDVAQLHPKETGIFASKPNFRQMHQLIIHAGICRRLDCWRVHVTKKHPGITSLDDFASIEPCFKDLEEMANEIACTYVQIASHRLYRARNKQPKERDAQFENALLLNKYFLFYEELSYAMNCGDIGRVETCMVSWIPLLKATGKHKYATHMMNFLSNVHFVYPARLRRAIQYHILVNPTGQPMKWCAVDWCVELNNLFTKVKNGGKGSNRTVERIILESPLVQIYRNVQGLVQRNFGLMHTTTNHAAPDMKRTFQSVQEQYAINSPHVVTLGRKSRCEIEDLNEKGHALMDKGEQGADRLDEEPMEIEGDDVNVRANLEDVMVELL